MFPYYCWYSQYIPNHLPWNPMKSPWNPMKSPLNNHYVSQSPWLSPSIVSLSKSQVDSIPVWLRQYLTATAVAMASMASLQPEEMFTQWGMKNVDFTRKILRFSWLGSLLGHYLLFTYSSSAKTYHVGFVDLHRSMWRSPQRSSPPGRSQGAGALHHNIGIIISVYLVTRIPRFAAERANCLNVAELKHLDSRHVSNKNGPKNLDLFHHSWVIPCHRTTPKGSKGLEHLGQEISRNLQQIVPIGFHHRHEVLSRELAGRILQWPNVLEKILRKFGEHPWRKMMIHQQKQRNVRHVSPAKMAQFPHLQKPPTTTNGWPSDQTRPLSKKRPERWDTSARLRGSTHPHLSDAGGETSPYLVNGPRWHRRVIDVESMSNICGEFCETKMEAVWYSPCYWTIAALYLPIWRIPTRSSWGGSSRPRFRVLKFLHSLLKKPSFQKKETFQQKISAQHPETMSKICMYIYIYHYMVMGQNLVPL